MIFDAIRQGDAEQIRTLLAADPSLADSRTPEGASLALWAVYTRHPEATPLRTLLPPAPPLAGGRRPEGASLALWAVYTRHPELAPLVLGSRPPDFFEACALGADARIVELLAVDRQLVEQYSADGFTAL